MRVYNICKNNTRPTFESWVGFEPTHDGFANRSVNRFATRTVRHTISPFIKNTNDNPVEYLLYYKHNHLYHMGTRSWTTKDLRLAVKSSLSIREVILKLGLVPAGGNYEQIKSALVEASISTEHFTGKGWRINRTFGPQPRIPLSEILVKYSTFQSFKLKKRLFSEGLKQPACELCGWAEQSLDGRIPLELDHVNGDHYDNRIGNLRILCPNCHSLQPTHRGKNQRRARGSSKD